MSIGFQNPISGSNSYFRMFAYDPRSPGKGISGYMPQTLYNVDKRYPEYEQIRFTLKQAWNTTYPSQLAASKINKKPIQTPFRVIMNAGDLLSREYYSCGGPCQSFQSRPNVKGIKGSLGHIGNSCIPQVWYSPNQLDSSIPAAACNVKFVYDSSDYTTYLKQKAVNKNYNDFSYGGNDYNTSQSAIRAAHRY
jgi:hypothetical protein